MKNNQNKKNKKVDNGILYQDEKSMFEDITVKVNFEINPLDRLIAIKDFFIFCEECELDPRSIGAYACYEEYLKTGKMRFL